MSIRTDNLYLATSNARAAILFEKLLERPAVQQILAALNSDGEEARVIGGAVRDCLMGRPVGDIDIATTASPETVISTVNRKGWKAVPTGIDHGTVTVVINNMPFEVTTLRRDISTDGRRAHVAFTRDFAEDARRRDFTINAMSLTLDGVVNDYGNGRDDARTGHIRFMGDPETRIREDYLRILRFFRFQASHGSGAPAEDALAACAKNKAGLDQLSRERIRQEILKLLPAVGALDAVTAMERIGLWEHILRRKKIVPGQLGKLVELEAILPTALSSNTSAIRRLAALLDAETVLPISEITDHLRLSRREETQLLQILKFAPTLNAAPSESLFARAYLAAGGATSVDALLVALARNPHSEANFRNSWFATAETILERKPVMPFRNVDFDAHAIPHGPMRGDIINAATEHWIEAGLPSDKPAISAILAKAMKG
jgi:poly(A) polymerase